LKKPDPKSGTDQPGNVLPLLFGGMTNLCYLYFSSFFSLRN
jgi:hypothetical protein